MRKKWGESEEICQSKLKQENGTSANDIPGETGVK